jgi:hypothetical protein
MKMILAILATTALTLVAASAKDVDIPVTELPKVVTDAISSKHPNSQLLSAEKDVTMKGEIQHFEVKIKDGEVTRELTVLNDGTIKETKND